MKKVLLMTLSVICVSGLAYGQDVGSIDIFADPGLTSCNITTPPAGVFSAYIAHTHVGDGATAVQFKLDTPPTMINVGEIPSFQLTIGSTTTGVSISYSACKTGTFQILLVNYVPGGVTPPCSWISVVPDPSDPGIQFADCSSNTVYLPSAGQARVNPDGTCSCTVPVNETTWGGIKALYTN